MTTTHLRGGLTAGLVVAALFASLDAFAQESPAKTLPSAIFTPPESSLARIQTAVATEPALVIGDVARFYIEVTARRPTFADYLKGSGLGLSLVAPQPPGRSPGSGAGGGIDLIQLVSQGVHWLQKVHRERQVRLIRERIDRELEALGASDR